MSDQPYQPIASDDDVQKQPSSPSEVVKKVIGILRTDEMRSVTSEEMPPTGRSARPDEVASTRTRQETSLTKTEKPLQSVASREVPKPVSSSSSSRTEDVPTPPPWALEQFFNGEVDLDLELNKRMPNLPMMSTLQFRALGANPQRHIATLTTQDNSASFLIETDQSTKVTHFSFVLGSMLTLRFMMDELSDADRTRWMDLMRRDGGGLSFLWGVNRWTRDYLICVNRRHHTNIFAFSPNRFEAGVRVTAPIMKQLTAWLHNAWTKPITPDDPDKPILTW